MSEQKKFEFTTPVAVVLAGLVVAAAILYTGANPAVQGAAESAGGALPASVSVSAPSAKDHIRGSLSAPIVLIEYSDFQCPFCGLVHATLGTLVASSNGKIAWVMRNFPLSSIHPEANPAANAAECIADQLGSEGYFKYADAVFKNQDKLSASYSRTLAGEFGANLQAYDSCIASGKHQATIDAQVAEAQNNGGQGTPYTIVYGNGKQIPISGAQPIGNFQAVIQQL